MIRRHRIAPLLLVAMLFVTLPAGAATGGDAIIQSVGTDDYPDVLLNITLPAELMAEGTEPQFVLTENGQPATLLSTERLTEDVDSVDVVLLVDTSGSMKGESIDTAKRAAKEFASAMVAPNRVAVIAFDTRARTVRDFTDDDIAVAAAAESLEARGETALYDALMLAGELAARPTANVASIVLLSDGGDTMSRASLDDAVMALRDSGAPVFAVALPSVEANPEALQTVASQTGGRLVSVATLTELPDLYKGIAREIQDSYTLLYRSNRPTTKDLEIAIEVSLGASTTSASTVVSNPRYAEVAENPAPALTVEPGDVLSLAGAVALVWISVMLLIAGLLLFVVRPRTRLDHMRYYEQLQDVERSGGQGALDENGLRARMVDAVDFVAGKTGFSVELRSRLERAGLPLRPAEYVTGHVVFVVIAGVFMQLVSGSFIASMGVVLVAAFAPIIYIDMRISRRQRAFDEQLPDILALVAGSLRAGWGMLQAIDMVVQESSPPARDEFHRVQVEARLGLSVEEALEAMALRVGSDDFSWAVSAIAIQREVGGNLAEVLDIVAKTIRDRGAMRRHVRGLTAEGRLSAIILVALPFFEAAVLMLVSPDYMRLLFTTVPGLFLLLVGTALLLVGVIWLNKAMKVEV